MTIHEVENITGLPRANVRFYENEGLIAPKREKNGYRDYSQSDVEKLSKIKLLRALEFFIEDIRSLDSETANFSELLRQRIDTIDTEKSQLTRSQEVLSEMLTNGADYSSLDSGFYLEELQKPTEISPTPSPIVVNEETFEKPGVWRRYFARSLDFCIYDIIIYAIFICIFHINTSSYRWFNLFHTLLTAILMLIFEPISLWIFGTTPGKWLLGISVTGTCRKKLTYSEALSRTAELILYGYGLMIPVVSLIRVYKSCKTAKSGDENEWEWYTQLKLSEKSAKQVISYISFTAVLVLIFSDVMLSPRVAPNRGDITIAELVENYNHYSDYFFTDNWKLDENLKWSSKYISNITPGLLPSIGYSIGNSGSGTKLKRITVTNSKQDDSSIYMSPDLQKIQTIVLAFIESQENPRIFTNDINYIRTLTNDWSRNYSFTLHGVSITYTVQYNGTYSQDSITSKNGEPVSINYTLEMALTE